MTMRMKRASARAVTRRSGVRTTSKGTIVCATQRVLAPLTLFMN